MIYSKSRKVNAMVKLKLKIEKKQRELSPLIDDCIIRLGRLTGGQMGEYSRIMANLMAEGADDGKPLP